MEKKNYAPLAQDMAQRIVDHLGADRVLIDCQDETRFKIFIIASQEEGDQYAFDLKVENNELKPNLHDISLSIRWIRTLESMKK